MRRFIVRRVLVGVGALVFAVVATVLFVHYTLPSVLVVHYRQQIDLAFKDYFTPELNQHLAAMGFTMPTTPPARCDNGPYSSSSPCARYTGTDYLPLDVAALQKWQAQSRTLDSYLARHAWQRVPNYGDTFSSLPANTSKYQLTTSFSRERDGVHCFLTASYVHTQPSPAMSVSEHCFKSSISPAEWVRSR